MASFQGKLFVGTGSCHGRASSIADPSQGRVYATRAGRVVSHEYDIGAAWTHVAAVRRGRELSLYVDGQLSQTTQSAIDAVFDVSNHAVLKIGSGPQSHFHGKLREIRLYNRALGEKEVHSIHTDSMPPSDSKVRAN
jgi:hypothetical protein